MQLPSPARPSADRLPWATAVVILFAAWMLLSQLSDFHGQRNGIASIAGAARRAGMLAEITNIVDRDAAIHAAGSDRYLDLVLPPTTRIFMADMTGPTNATRSGNYYFLNYYVFPRQVDVSLDGPARITEAGLDGRTTESDQEMRDHGYDLRVDLDANSTIRIHPLHEFSVRAPVNPPWFDATADALTAFFLPLFTAIAGAWLLRLLFPMLSERLPLPSQLAYGFGLGMMAVAALTLGIKLCGFRGYHVVSLLAAVASAIELVRRQKTISRQMFECVFSVVRRPYTAACAIIIACIFVILFRLAMLEGIVEFDAVASWALKAKIIHLYTGRDLIDWFSNPRFGYAHLDYPTLVPSLHAATYDALGHVDDFVTKFWPTWMLLFLLGAIASVNRDETRRFPVTAFFLVGLLLVPATLQYGQGEGGTMPMIFFTALGLLECIAWQLEKNPAHLALGMTFFFGAAMTKFEGMICFALAAAWILLAPSARPPFKWSPRLVPVAAFWLLAALPFLWLRLHLPVLHWQSHWLQYALAAPGRVLEYVPPIFAILVAQLFFSDGFAAWSADNGHLHYDGKWEGYTSLYNHSTGGLAWFCLMMTIIVVIRFPQGRPAVCWVLAMLVGMIAFLSIVIASLAEAAGLNGIVTGLTNDLATGRYLLPMLIAYATVIVTVCFGKFTDEPGAPTDHPQ